MSAPATSLELELRRISTARRKRDKAERELADAIADARKAGASLQTVAAAAGISRQRVWQIERGI